MYDQFKVTSNFGNIANRRCFICSSIVENIETLKALNLIFQQYYSFLLIRFWQAGAVVAENVEIFSTNASTVVVFSEVQAVEAVN